METCSEVFLTRSVVRPASVRLDARARWQGRRVAGASRAAGRAIAVELGAAGATVYCTGRTGECRRSAMDRPEHADVRVRGVLCFVGAERPAIFRKPVVVNGVTAVWPTGLPAVLRPKKAPAPIDVAAVTEHLRAAFRYA